MIKEQREEILATIVESARKSGRSPEAVSLMAVSKMHPYEDVLEAFACGQRLFGENKVQEVQGKFPAVLPKGMELHLIGHLQSNKVRKILPFVQQIDSVDSARLARKISDEALKRGTCMPVLFEFNTSGEESKSGFESADELYRTLDLVVGELGGIRPQGLMTIGPLGGSEAEVRRAFASLRELAEQCKSRYPELCFDTLSMGMSSDFPIAIEEGSTMVRVGTRLFGKRDYTK
jgi:pyridoxal phosphate enzyme (YggS family)